MLVTTSCYKHNLLLNQIVSSLARLCVTELLAEETIQPFDINLKFAEATDDPSLGQGFSLETMALDIEPERWNGMLSFKQYGCVRLDMNITRLRCN